MWATERSGRDLGDIAERFPHFNDWLRGSRRPTLRQLEQFAKATHAPLGALLLPEPLSEPLPVPDFRTMPDAETERPSVDLLDTIFLCEQRQEWYREFARSSGQEALPLVGSLSLATPVPEAAQALQDALDFGVDERAYMPRWSDALTALIERAESAGVLVMVSGIVGGNTHRALDPQEFRGFAVVDELAPVIFVNGADTKAAQIFTLAHELAHVWLGQSAVSSANLVRPENHEVERWCNAVAAEFLVPMNSFRDDFNRNQPLDQQLRRLARRYKVSTLVVLRRVLDAGYIDRPTYEDAFEDELRRVLAVIRESEGGNYYNTQPYRTSRRFARAIVESTLEGQTLHRDAFRLLGFKKFSTFEGLREHLGIH
jgi:Zn-dependent peptidase ImmA (M78 family)/transcriptional regulator with XRE-family HTH domain